MEFDAKGFQNGTQNDANTYHKSTPTLVTKTIMKLINNQVSLKGKIIEIHCKNKFFGGLEGCMR